MTDAPAPLASDPAAGTDAAASSIPEASAPRHPHIWANVSSPFALGFTVTLGGLIAIALGVAFINLSTIIIYVVFALFAALGLDPIVRWLERHKVGRAWGIVIVYTGFAIILVGILTLIVPTVVNQITSFVKDIPTIITNFEKTDFYAWLNNAFSNSIGTIIDEIEKFITNPSNIASITGGVLKFGVTVATTISGLIIVLVLSLYFLAGLPAIKTAFNRLVPARNRPRVAVLTEQITDSIGGYLMGMVILAFCNSVVAFLLHVFLGLPFPALMAVVAFLLTLIPLIGSVLYWGVATVIALFSSPLAALIFAIIYLIYMQLEAYVLTPKIMNRTISVPGALVVIGALVGGTLLGLLGALVAIPVTASILLIVKQVVIPRQDAKVALE